MYEEFYGLERRPFSAIPHADDFVTTPAIQESLDSILHALNNAAGIAILTGGSGLGKTAVCRRIATDLASRFDTVYLNCSGIETRRALLQAILFELNADYVGLSEHEARLQLFRHLQQQIGTPDHPHRALALILDDAHLLPSKLFEELKILSDYAPDGISLIRLMLSGLIELEEKLAEPQLFQLSQRIAVQAQLHPLTLGESAQVLGQRFALCGSADLQSLLTEPALSLICQSSDGNFRCLTQLTEQALVLGFEKNCRPVTDFIVRNALESLRELPLRWNEIGMNTSDHGLNENPEISVSDVAEINQECDAVETPGANSVHGNKNETASRESFQNWLNSVTPEADELETSGFSDDDENSFTSFTSQASPTANRTENSTANSAEVSQFESVSDEKASPEFAVFEVGADLPGSEAKQNEQIATNDLGSANVIPNSEPLVAEQFGIPFVPLQPDPFSVPMSPPVSHMTDMTEVAVFDRYTLLDRQFEVPEDRFDLFDSRLLDDVPHELLNSSFDETPESFYPAASLHESAANEIQLLESIQRLRQEVLSQTSIASDCSSQSHFTPRFDIVQPETEFEGTIPFNPVDLNSPAPISQVPNPPVHESIFRGPNNQAPENVEQEGRFAKLFTRLRLRKSRHSER